MSVSFSAPSFRFFPFFHRWLKKTFASSFSVFSRSLEKKTRRNINVKKKHCLTAPLVPCLRNPLPPCPRARVLPCHPAPLSPPVKVPLRKETGGTPQPPMVEYFSSKPKKKESANSLPIFGKQKTKKKHQPDLGKPVMVESPKIGQILTKY